MRDQMNDIHPVRVLSPSAGPTDTTAQVGQIVDVSGYGALTFLIATGAIADVDATFTTLVEHGNDATLSDATGVPDANLVGTEALAGFKFDDDNKLFKIGYVGSKRYVRLTITPVANASAAAMCVIGVLGRPELRPTSNPPA